jgi:hypothetical protein
MPFQKLQHSRSKHISNYGGVGSIIETTDCSIIIETFDNWGYSNLNEALSKFILKDDRLLQRLKIRFPNLKHLVSIPSYKSYNQSNPPIVQPKANYFPKWFYCPQCHRFAEYAEWKKRWPNARLNFFDPPKCANNDCKESHLEQIRFVSTCADGHIHDLPWAYWNNRLPNDKTNIEDNDDETTTKLSGPQLDFSKKCCENQSLKYKISRENTELSGIWIECENCKKKANLKGIFNYEQKCLGKKYWLGQTVGKFSDEPCEQTTSVKVKTSNSVYYANTLSSLFIPDLQINLSNENRIELDNLIDSGQIPKEQIIQFYSIQKGISKELIEQYLETGEIKYIPDNVYRQTEYEYFLNKEQPEDKQIKFRVINCEDQIFGFSKLVKIDKLKRISVQTSFTRNEPIDVDSILQDQNNYEYKAQ